MRTNIEIDDHPIAQARLHASSTALSSRAPVATVCLDSGFDFFNDQVEVHRRPMRHLYIETDYSAISTDLQAVNSR